MTTSEKIDTTQHGHSTAIEMMTLLQRMPGASDRCRIVEGEHLDDGSYQRYRQHAQHNAVFDYVDRLRDTPAALEGFCSVLSDYLASCLEGHSGPDIANYKKELRQASMQSPPSVSTKRDQPNAPALIRILDESASCGMERIISRAQAKLDCGSRVVSVKVSKGPFYQLDDTAVCVEYHGTLDDMVTLGAITPAMRDLARNVKAVNQHQKHRCMDEFGDHFKFHRQRRGDDHGTISRYIADPLRAIKLPGVPEAIMARSLGYEAIKRKTGAHQTTNTRSHQLETSLHTPKRRHLGLVWINPTV